VVLTTKSDHQEEAQAQRWANIEVDCKEERCGEQEFYQKKKMTHRNASDQVTESSGVERTW
jgi:predicted nucleic-acid-binding Zn-ribbon protein